MRRWNLSPWSVVEEIWSAIRGERDLSRMIRATDPGLLANLIKTHRLSLSLISLLKQLKIFFMLQIIQPFPVSGDNENCQQIFQGQLLFADVKRSLLFCIACFIQLLDKTK